MLCKISSLDEICSCPLFEKYDSPIGNCHTVARHYHGEVLDNIGLLQTGRISLSKLTTKQSLHF